MTFSDRFPVVLRKLYHVITLTETKVLSNVKSTETTKNGPVLSFPFRRNHEKQSSIRWRKHVLYVVFPLRFNIFPFRFHLENQCKLLRFFCDIACFLAMEKLIPFSQSTLDLQSLFFAIWKTIKLKRNAKIPLTSKQLMIFLKSTQYFAKNNTCLQTNIYLKFSIIDYYLF